MLRGEHVVVGAGLARQLALVADVRLGRRPVDALVVGQAALRERDERRHHLFGDRRHLDLLDRVAELLQQRGRGARAPRCSPGRWGCRAAPAPSAPIRSVGPAPGARVLARTGARGPARCTRRAGRGRRSRRAPRPSRRRCGRPRPRRPRPASSGRGAARARGSASGRPARSRRRGSGSSRRRRWRGRSGTCRRRPRRRRRRSSRPGERSVSQGLRLGPKRRFSAAVITPNSGVLVRPHSTKPASTSASTTSSLSSLGPSGAPCEPNVTGQPATGVRSLIGIGTPRNGALLAGGEAAVGLARGGAGLLVVAPGDRVQLRVELVDGRQAGVEQLHRGELARGAAPRRARAPRRTGPRSAMRATLPGCAGRAPARVDSARVATRPARQDGASSPARRAASARRPPSACTRAAPTSRSSGSSRSGSRRTPRGWASARPGSRPTSPTWRRWKRAVPETVERFGGIDVAVANAGIAFMGTLATAPVEQVERTLAVNLLGVWRTDRAVVAELAKSRGYLLNISSLSAITHAPMMGPYIVRQGRRRGAHRRAAPGARAARRRRRLRLLRLPRHRPRESQLRPALDRRR